MFDAIERNAVRIAFAIIAFALWVALQVLATHADAGNARTVYRATNDADAPTVVIRGAGFASAEDSIGLRVVDFDPAHNRVVYRVVTP